MKNQKIYSIYVLLALVLFSMPVCLYSQNKKVYEIHPASQIVFKGRSNINQFVFRSEEIYGMGCIDTTVTSVDSLDGSLQVPVNGFFQVDVKSFNSGNSRMNRDMYAALKAEYYRYIRFDIKSVKFVQYIGETGAQFQAEGYLQVAGVKNLITLTISVIRQDERLYHLHGSKQIHMTDYNITPPQALLGLIQTKNQLTVEFDLYTGQQSRDAIAVTLPCEKHPTTVKPDLTD
ncbi:YceI family protein [candidate division KSB1 bacterium]|nr:YceI family protein [candidate division KSB1 bacterium]